MTKLKRRAPAVALIAILALLGSLAVATDVLGKHSRKVIRDPRGDGGAFVPHTQPRVCDVVQATSELAKEGHLRHTVTVRGPITPSLNAPPVIITRQRVHDSIGLASFILSPGEPDVYSRLKNHRRTIVYFVKRSVIADAVGRHDRYFWVVDQCTLHDDRVPDSGSIKQRLRRYRHHR